MRKTYQQRKVETAIMVDNLDEALYATGTAQATAYISVLNSLKSQPTGMTKANWTKMKGDVRRLAREHINEWEANNA